MLNSRKQKVELYGNAFSPPCRIVTMTLECLNVKHRLVETLPQNGDTKTEEFLEVKAKRHKIT